MKVFLSILFDLCLTAHAQTNAPLLPPGWDTNTMAIRRAFALAYQSNHPPVIVPTQVQSIFINAMSYPAWMPIGGYVLHSSNGVDWQFARAFIVTQTNTLYFTNVLPSTNLYMAVLIPPDVVSVSNQAATNQ